MLKFFRTGFHKTRDMAFAVSPSRHPAMIAMTLVIIAIIPGGMIIGGVVLAVKKWKK